MREEVMSSTGKKPSNKLEFTKKKKRKHTTTEDESDFNLSFGASKILKKALMSKTSDSDTPGFLHYKNTTDYAKVVAKPNSSPSRPRIFKAVKHRNGKLNNSDSFLFKLLSLNSLNTKVSERFHQVIFNSEKLSEKKKKVEKIGNKLDKNVDHEKTVENKIKNKEKVIKKVKRKLDLEEETDGHESDKIEQNSFREETEEHNNGIIEQDSFREETEEHENSIFEQNKVREESEQHDNDKIEQDSFRKELEHENDIIEQDHYRKEAYTTYDVDIYKVPEKEILIFHMPHPCKFSFNGEFKITVIAGKVEVLGYSLSSCSSNNSVNMYSPNFCIPLVVETKPAKDTAMEEILKKLENNMSEEDYNSCSRNLKPEDCILFVEQIKSSFGIVINKYFDLPVFPKDSEDIFLMTDAVKNLQTIFNFKFPKYSRTFNKNPQWDKIPLGQCTVLCGGKGVGKSTLLRYFANKFVSSGEKVLCLDFDPGQPEFYFPGCLTAVIIDQPLIGPNFTHVMDPILIMNYGAVDVSPNPCKYLECAKYIINYCKSNEDLLKMKWFVNTMGFCRGLGVRINISLLKLLKPDTVIQIKGVDPNNNYPFYLTPVTLNSKWGFHSMPGNDVILSHDLRRIDSFAAIRNKQIYLGVKQRQFRDIMSLSYFSKAVSPPYYNFNAVTPYLISFSKLYLGIDFYINPNNVLKAFNGSVVSLSKFEPEDEDIFTVESEEVYFKVIVKPTVVPSLGIGLVRGIDCQKQKIYLLTHLSIETLEQVNCLTLGKVCAPHSMFLKQEAVEGPTVYTALSTTEAVHRVRRKFRVPVTGKRLK